MPPEQQNQQPFNPPGNPQPLHPSQYEFIMNPQQPKRRTSMKGPASILFIIIAVAVIIGLFVVIIGLSKGGPDIGKTMITAAQEQQEIARVAKEQQAFLTQQNVKNFAVNTNLSMTSDQTTLVNFLGNNGVKVSGKQLALGQNNTTDTTLATAQTTNALDQTLVKVLQNELTSYKATLKQAYAETQSSSARHLLIELNKHADLLLIQSKQ